MYGALRGHLCDSTAFLLLFIIVIAIDSNTDDRARLMKTELKSLRKLTDRL